MTPFSDDLPQGPTDPVPAPFGQVDTWQRARTATPVAGSRHSPADLAREYTFFNHGLLFSLGGFDAAQDPVAEWFQQQYGVPTVLRQEFPFRLFRGMTARVSDEPYTWDFVLCAVPNYAWMDLREHLCGIVAVSRPEQRAYSVFYQVVHIPDPMQVSQKGFYRAGMATIPVTLFCIDATDGIYLFSSGSLVAPPALVRRPPGRGSQSLAVSLLKKDSIDVVAERRNPAFSRFLRKYQKHVDALRRKGGD